MTIVRRVAIAVTGLLVLLLAVAGLGIAVVVWLRSWHSDFTAAAGQTGAISDPVLQDMLDSLRSRTGIMTIVMIIVVVVAIALGILAMVLLRRVIGRQLRATVTGIGGSAGELLAVASQVAAATAQTVAATNETAATVEEVKQMTIIGQERATEAFDLSQEVAERCRYGDASAQQNVGKFERIRADMDVVAEAIDRLNDQTRSVGDIIATVSDIAEQSNLLSVNASIEAAKAGDQGKGFTVVAQEVKNLAEQSKQAVTQVRGVLSEIQKASALAVSAAEQSRDAVQAGSAEAGRAIENTRAEVELANKAAEATLEISATSRQQQAGMEQISQAILSINAAGNQLASGTRQVEQEAKQLQDVALGLRGLVDSTSA